MKPFTLVLCLSFFLYGSLAMKRKAPSSKAQRNKKKIKKVASDHAIVPVNDPSFPIPGFQMADALYVPEIIYSILYHTHPEYHQLLKEWIAPFRHAILPEMQTSLVWETLSIAILFAAFSGDHKFLEIVDLDIPFWVGKSDKKLNTAELLTILDDIVYGRVKYITGNALVAIESEIETRSAYDLLGWPKDKLREPLLRLNLTSKKARSTLTKWLQI